MSATTAQVRAAQTQQRLDENARSSADLFDYRKSSLPHFFAGNGNLSGVYSWQGTGAGLLAFNCPPLEMRFRKS